VVYNRPVLANNTANTLNYISQQWPRGKLVGQPQYLGLVPIVGKYQNWGVQLEGEYFAAAHLFQTAPGFCWGDDPADTAEHADAKPWVLMFYGTDNASYFTRHATSFAAHQWLQNAKTIDYAAPGVMYYNS
jgi:hypothetical protein